MTKTEQRPTYTVTLPMVQIQGHPRAGFSSQPLVRLLRQGDVVPTWVADSELARLQQLGAISQERP